MILVPFTARAAPVGDRRLRHAPRWTPPQLPVVHLTPASSLAEAQQAMGMDWADRHGTKEAIPPAYTEHIGHQLIGAVDRAAS